MLSIASALFLAVATGGAAPNTSVEPAPQSQQQASAESSVWGPLGDLAGYEWDMRRRYVWLEPGRRLAWQQKPTIGDWRTLAVYSLQGDAMTVDYTWPDADGTVQVPSSGRATITFPQPCNECVASIEKQGDGFLVTHAGGSYLIARNTAGWQASEAEAAAARTALAALETLNGSPSASAEAAPAAPRGPIILSGQTSQPVNRPAPAPSQPPPIVTATGAASTRPIVLASAPPPPARMREAPTPASGARTAPPAAPTSREAQMQAQVETRRVQAAREAEAERMRQAQLAEERRLAEQRRREQEQANANAWGEAFGMLGALAGGVAAGMQTGGDMTAITAGMAAGSAMAAPNSEIAAASNANFEVERQRYEEERAFEQQVIAELHNPNNPLTQQARREQEERDARYEADMAEIERSHRQAREEADREALMAQRESERASANAAAEDDRRAEEQQRLDERRREEERRERDRAAREEQAQREADERAAEAERRRVAAEQEQERERQRRAAAEAQRHRLVDFKEGVVLCHLSGPQAQFGNWTCEGPLQMNYVNFERPNYAAALGLTGCDNARELPRAGSHRAFGCGYGVHPTNPGALRNVPEMLGVFVDGRITFRCPISSTSTCRSR